MLMIKRFRKASEASVGSPELAPVPSVMPKLASGAFGASPSDQAEREESAAEGLPVPEADRLAISNSQFDSSVENLDGSLSAILRACVFTARATARHRESLATNIVQYTIVSLVFCLSFARARRTTRHNILDLAPGY